MSFYTIGAEIDYEDSNNTNSNDNITDGENSLSEEDKEESGLEHLDDNESDLDFENENFSKWTFSGHDIYPPDEEDSQIVEAAKEGNLRRVKAILQDLPLSGALKVSTVNGARRWTEVDEKWGYDNSYEWFGDTALIASARKGHVEIVQLLLLHLADPTLKSCPTDDKQDTAVSAAENMKTILDREVKNIESGLTLIYDVYGDPVLKVKDILNRIGSYGKIINLLKTAGNYWKTAKYYSSSHSNSRKKAFSGNPNQPTDIAALLNVIEKFDIDVIVEEDILNNLPQKYSTIQSNKRSNAATSVCQGTVTPIQAMTSSTYAYQNTGIKNLSSTVRAVTVQTVDKISKSASCVKDVSFRSIVCQGMGCKNTSANNCSNASCSKCCVGECFRHGSGGRKGSAKRKRLVEQNILSCAKRGSLSDHSYNAKPPPSPPYMM